MLKLIEIHNISFTWEQCSCKWQMVLSWVGKNIAKQMHILSNGVVWLDEKWDNDGKHSKCSKNINPTSSTRYSYRSCILSKKKIIERAAEKPPNLNWWFPRLPLTRISGQSPSHSSSPTGELLWLTSNVIVWTLKKDADGYDYNDDGDIDADDDDDCKTWPSWQPAWRKMPTELFRPR